MKKVMKRTSFAELADKWTKKQDPREARKALRKSLRKLRKN